MKNEALNTKRLKIRYLVWLYKTTKEQLDRIDRKFTQLEVDRFILQKLEKASSRLSASQSQSIGKFLHDFREYIAKKEGEAVALKFGSAESKKERPEYLFLRLKFSAIEAKIETLLGKKALLGIRDLYEQEMFKRIIEEREHR